MSVAGYFGAKPRELRLKEGDVGEVQGQVLGGRESVELAQARAAAKVRRPGERYLAVAEYDAVLRAHCRLDGEG